MTLCLVGVLSYVWFVVYVAGWVWLFGGVLVWCYVFVVGCGGVVGLLYWCCVGVYWWGFG